MALLSKGIPGALVAAAAIAAGSCAAVQAQPAQSPQDAMAGTYRLTFDTGETRTWAIQPGCSPAVADPCITFENTIMTQTATFRGGRWSFTFDYPVNRTCSSPPVSAGTWSWDPATLKGTIVDTIEAGCGQPARTRQSGAFTLTKIG